MISIKIILEYLSSNNRWAIALAGLLIVVGGFIMKVQSNEIKKVTEEKNTQVKLKNALLDTVSYYQNEEKDWVAEKLTIQASVDELEKDNGQLNADQKKLLKKVKDVEKDNSVITAALINAEFVIDSLTHAGTVDVDTTNKTVTFKDLTNKDFNYDLIVAGVTPFPLNTNPNLLFKSIKIPNEQFIEFHWRDQKKEGYPIAFSVSNSNKYIKVYDINSYAIPELKKETINPTGWQKFGNWMKTNKNIVTGIAIGAGGMFVITNL